MSATSPYNSSNSLQYAGDVNIERMLVMSKTTGVYQNIKQQVLGVYIYEDIFSPFITGKVILNESLDLHNVFPLIGEEFLKMRIVTPGISGAVIDDEFSIYKMSDKIETGKKSVAYELNFISKEALVDMNLKNSKVYSGKISDIVGTFIHDGIDGLGSSKKFYIENTRNRIKYVSPYWSPVKNLSFLADNAISETQSPSFLFFENRDGFNFRSLENLYDNNVVQEFIQDDYSRDMFPRGGNVLNSTEDYKRVSSIHYSGCFDYMDRARSGMYGSKLISYDSTKKTYTVKNFALQDRFANQIHLNEYEPYSIFMDPYPDALKINFPRAFETFTSFGDTTNARVIQERLSFLKLAENQKVEITVIGKLDYTVGQVVDLRTYKKKPNSGQNPVHEDVDKIISGRYLISAVNHQITHSGHECILELIKDSLLRGI